jgi:hypothetical protein
MNAQVISKKRVVDHGEVLTGEREVHDMLSLVQQETERIDSRFLEPACGTGNFLLPILERKLTVVKRKYGKSQLEFERYSVVAVGSVYGVDILEDNVYKCRERLFAVFDDIYTALYKGKSKDALRDVIRYVLNKNILWGDALSLKTVSKNPKPIIFSEWSPFNGSMIKRRDFLFEELIPDNAANITLFKKAHISDLGMPAFIPTPVKEYPLTHFLLLNHENAN